MAISMYQISVPVFLKTLGNLAAILDKGAAFAAAKKVEPSVLLEHCRVVEHRERVVAEGGQEHLLDQVTREPPTAAVCEENAAPVVDRDGADDLRHHAVPAAPAGASRRR